MCTNQFISNMSSAIWCRCRFWWYHTHITHIIFDACWIHELFFIWSFNFISSAFSNIIIWILAVCYHFIENMTLLNMTPFIVCVSACVYFCAALLHDATWWWWWKKKYTKQTYWIRKKQRGYGWMQIINDF